MYTDRIHGLKLLNVLDQIYNKVQLLTLDKVCQKGHNANMYMYDEYAFIKICMCNRQTIQEPQPDHHFFPRSEHNDNLIISRKDTITDSVSLFVIILRKGALRLIF